MYGLNFSSKDDADVFATAMIRALEVGISIFSRGSLDPYLRVPGSVSGSGFAIRISLFKLLDALFRGLKASPVAEHK